MTTTKTKTMTMATTATSATTTRLACAALIAVLGCGGGHSHEGGEHTHGHGHGHGHATDELPGQAVTLWSDRHELFMEYPPLVVGRESAFAAHVTVLPNEAAAAGVVSVTVKLADGSVVTGRSDAPRPVGIFRPKVRPERPGKCQLFVTIEHGGAKDELDAGPCEVFADVAAARAALVEEAEPPGRITYLKEQQWKTEFATLAVGERELQAGVRATGEIRPMAGKEARLTAPVAGRVVVVDPAPTLGSLVRKGQLLATVAPRLASGGGDRSSLEGDALAARAELEAAEAQAARAERLLAEQAASQRQVEEARTRVRVAKARLDAASGRLGQYAAGASGTGGAGRGGLQIRSPIDGTLVVVKAASGSSVEEGEELFVVMDLDRLWLEVAIFEVDLSLVEAARAAWFTIDGHDAPFEIDATNGRVVTLGRVLDPRTRTAPLIFELANPGGKLRVGQFAQVVVATGPPVRTLAVPESALVDDAGTLVAYVEVEGEAFERRPLILGLRAKGWVAVEAGLDAGERVVVRGAYDIKLASAGGSIPAHGHAH